MDIDENEIFIKNIEGIDESAARHYNDDDISILVMRLRVFAEFAPEVVADCRDHLKKGDYQSLIADIHALKGNALGIGAVACSEEAKRLEFAGKAGDIDTMVNGAEPLFAMVTELIDNIKKQIK